MSLLLSNKLYWKLYVSHLDVLAELLHKIYDQQYHVL